MSDPDFRDGAGRSRTAYRGWLILLITLPVLLLGGSYFLFVEYLFAQPGGGFLELLATLRMGGAAFIALAVVLALCSGLVVVGRMTRPVRLLLAVIEEGRFTPETGALLYRSDWDAFYLYKRLQGLLQQSQTAAAARSELDAVRGPLRELATELGGVGDVGAGRDDGTVGLVAEIARTLQTNRDQLTQFFLDLRTQTEILRGEVEELRQDSTCGGARIRPELPHAHAEVDDPGGNGGLIGGTGNGFHRSPAESSASALDEASERLRQLGTVLALEMERMSPDPAGLGVRYERFSESLSALELALTHVSSMKAEPDQVDDIGEAIGSGEPPAATVRWDHLEEGLGILEQRLDEVCDR